MPEDKPQGRGNAGTNKSFGKGQVIQSNQGNQGTQFSARDGELTACVHTDLTEPGGLSISFAHRNELIMLGIDINIKRWGEERTVFITYGNQGDTQWVTLKDPGDFDKLIAVINEVLGRLGIKDRIGGNIANLIRSVIADPKRYYTLAPTSAYVACGIGADVPQATPPSKHEAVTSSTNKVGAKHRKREDTGAQQVSLPDEVHEGENDRFVATRVFDYDGGTFSIVIKDREQPGKEVTVMLRLVRSGLSKVYTHVSVYSGGKIVLEGRSLPVGKILKQVRKELRTKAIRNDGPIADFIGRIYSLVIEETKRVRKALKEELGQKLLEELRRNHEFLNNPLQYITTKVLGILHFGDEIVKKASVLGVVTSRLPSKKRVNIAITGPSSSGKSNIQELLAKLIPRSWIQGGRVFAYSSPKAIFYEGESRVRGNVVVHTINVNHKVIVYLEPTPFYTRSEETLIGRELLKLLLSDAKEDEPLCHKAVDPEKKITRYYCVEGKPVVITTLPDEYVGWLKEQELVRLLPVSVDLNPEVEKDVFEFMLNEDEEYEKQFKQAALLVRFFLSLLPVVKSVKLSEDAKEAVRDTLGRYIGDTKTKRHIRRALRDLIGLAAAYELLNYTASIIQEGKEVPKVLDKLFVTGKSVKYVWDLVGDAIVGKAFGNPFEAQEERILRIIENAGGAMRRKDIIETMKPLKESTIKRLLNKLVDAEVLVRCPGKRGLYALPGKCPESNQITNYTQEESKGQGEGEQP